MEVARLLVELWLRDDGLGRAVAGLSWIAAAPVSEGVPTALSALRDIADADQELAMRALGYPWVDDDVLARDEWLAIEALRDIVAADLELGRRSAAFPWLTDGLTGGEARALDALRGVTSADLKLAMEIAALPWFADGAAGTEPDALEALSELASDDLELARLVAGLPWFTDGVDDGEPGALAQLRVTASTDPDLAALVARLPWFVNGLTDDERDALSALREIVLADLEIGRQLAGFPWFTDSVTSDEIDVLISVGDIASADIGLARWVAKLPWIADGLISDERDALSALREVVHADLEIGRRIAGFSWLTDGVTGVENIALYDLRDIASADIELARRVVHLPWLADGLTGSERYVLGPLRAVASADLDLAGRLVDLPWFVDNVTDAEKNALRALGVISPSDVEFGKRIAALRWFVDGVTYDEGRALTALRDGASVDLDLARRIAALPWFADGATGGEPDALEALSDMASYDAELARLIVGLPWFGDGVTDGEQTQLQVLRRFAPTDPGWVKLVAPLPWFADGLTGGERDGFEALKDMAHYDIELARLVVGLPWFTDELSGGDLGALEVLREMAYGDIELARLVAVLPWFVDGVTEVERNTIWGLHDIAVEHVELARRVASFSWLADDVTAHELQALTVIPTYALRTWDFTDSDGDGMTDAAETKYGFDPNDASSFPDEPEVFHAERYPIEDSEIGAHYEVGLDSVELTWTNPEDGTFSLRLRTSDSPEWNIYYGGHDPGKAKVRLNSFNLSGSEALVGRFTRYALDLSFVEEYTEFTIDLASVNLPDRSVIGNPSNRLAYTFSSDFPEEAEFQYREFLRRVFPLMYEHLGPPAETFNVFIEDVGASDAFELVDDGRTLLTDASFIPRLIVHEFVHAWNGQYSITSDEDWDYDDPLTGFEEGVAEGMAFEIIHEYVRSYPTHSASIQLLDYRPAQYWSSKTTSYDAIKNVQWTGAGDFWTHTDGQESRYSIAATTVQMMVRENPNFAKEFMAQYYQVIRDDPDWRPNRDDVIDIWTAIVPALNGYSLRESLDALPVFNGRKLAEGMYVLEAIRVYGESGDQQFAVAYAVPDGRLEWGIYEEELEDVPAWIRTSPGDDGYIYIDTQKSSFTVQVFDAYGEEYAVYNFETEWDRRPDGSPTGLGWYYAHELEMEKVPIGLYKETVTFTDYIEYDEGARQDYYFFGLQGFAQDRENEYVIMIGVDGVPEGEAEIVVDDGTHTATIENGVAIFRSTEWPFDMQGRFPITITNAESVSRSYYRTLIEAGSLHSFFQYQFIIVDTDFDGVEDQFE